MWKGLPKSGLEDYIGFIYLITELDTGKQYIGKKVLWNRRKLKPLKGKKRKRIVWRESDYKTYYGSCDSLSINVEKKGKRNYRREVLRLCKTKREMLYWEAKYQFDNDVLGIENPDNKDKYYNGNILGKIIVAKD